jgi:glycosyltransferase involved in cell wall biosynthesis
MKLLVFAHVPPPFHGQSYGVQLMLNGFGGDRRNPKHAASAPNDFGIECYHVNARLSKKLEDIGEFQGGKIFLILFHCLQAIWCRFRYGVTNFYYVPAPGKSVALYRDWLIMFICRPFYKKIILHWHAAGMARWLETVASIRIRSLTFRMLKYADLSIALSEFNRRDAEKLFAQRVAVVNVGVPDPCPQFEREVLPRRRARIAARKQLLARNPTASGTDTSTVNVLYLAHCTRDKGLFDTVEGVALANEKLAAEHSPLHLRLTLIGAFISRAEEKELHEFVQKRRVQNMVEYLGFVSAERKAQALLDADLFCFPTYYTAENQPGNLIEAMAFGLSIVTTRWRSLPEMLPKDYPGLVDPGSPLQIADALLRLIDSDLAEPLREVFVRRFTLERHLAGMAAALHSVESAETRTLFKPALQNT